MDFNQQLQLIKQTLDEHSQELDSNEYLQDMVFKWHSLFEKKPYKLEIFERRPFIKSEYGWSWYKNLVIPSLKLQLDGVDLDILDLETEIICLKKLNNGKFEEVKLCGKMHKKV